MSGQIRTAGKSAFRDGFQQLPFLDRLTRVPMHSCGKAARLVEQCLKKRQRVDRGASTSFDGKGGNGEQEGPPGQAICLFADSF